MSNRGYKKSSKSNKKHRTSNKNCKNKTSSKNSKSNNSGGLTSLTYPEIIALAATLAYSISEELDEDDLTILLVIIEVVLTNLQVIAAQRAVSANTQDTSIDDDSDIFDMEDDI